ncbi:MAG: hypothetical protein SGPRY_012104, partial [Prymnesium sp.]
VACAAAVKHLVVQQHHLREVQSMFCPFLNDASYLRYRLEGAEAPEDPVDLSGRFMLLRKVWTGIAEALGEILSGGVGLDVDQVTTMGGRLLYLGWGFFVLIVISSYIELIVRSAELDGRN